MNKLAKLTCTSFAFMLLLCSEATIVPTESVLDNSGFEDATNLNNWSAQGNATISINTVTNHVYRGSKSAYINTQDSSSGIKQDLAGKMDWGRTYMLSGRVKLDSSETRGRISIRVVAEVNGITYPQSGSISLSVADSGSGWHYINGIYDYNTNDVPDDIYLLITSDAGALKFYVDEIDVIRLETGLFNVNPASFISTLGAETTRRFANLQGIFDQVAASNRDVVNDVWSVSGGTYDQPFPHSGSSSYYHASPNTWTDYELEVSINIDTGTNSSNVSIGAFHTTASVYKLEINPSRGKLSLIKQFDNGVSQVLVSEDGYTINFDQFYDYKLVVNATTDTIEAYFDGTLELSHSDDSISEGGISLSTFRTNASFDDVTVTEIGTSTVLYSNTFSTAGSDSGWVTNYSTAYANDTSIGAEDVPAVLSLSSYDPSNATTAGKIIIPTTTSDPTESKVLDTIEEFVEAVGSSYSIVAVENEPNYKFTTADRTPDTNGDIPAVEWMKKIAQRLHDTINDPANSANLGHLRISTGSMDDAYKAFTDENSYRAGVPGVFLDAMIEWGNTDDNIDYIDLHMHQANIEESANKIAYLQSRAQKPIIATEWSEAMILNSWMNQSIDSTFLSNSGLPAAVKTTISTNADYVKACYENPVTGTEWGDFVESSPLTETYLQNAVDLFNQAGIVLTSYGAMRQYGSTKFDMKQLYANLTADLSSSNEYQANHTYVTQFQNIDRALPAPENQVKIDHFENGTGNWNAVQGTWSITSSPERYSQTKTTGVGYTEFDNVNLVDSHVSVEITPTAFSGSGNSVGLMARYTDNNNRYTALYRDSTNELIIQRKVSGTQTTLATTSYTMNTNQNYLFELVMIDQNLKLYVDHNLELEVTDTDTTLASGETGLYTFNTTATFDNYDVRLGRYIDDFESGSAPKWTATNGTWAVNTSNEYEQSSTSGTAFSTLDDLGWSDYAIEAYITPTAFTGSSNSIGINVRYTDNNNRYTLIYRDATNEFVLLKKVSGVQTVLWELPGMTLNENSTYLLKVEVVGSEIRAFLENRILGATTDSDLTSGKVGFFTFNTSGTFDDVKVSEL